MSKSLQSTSGNSWCAISRACIESLEPRELLAANIVLKYDGAVRNQANDGLAINLGTATTGTSVFSKKISIGNSGDAALNVSGISINTSNFINLTHLDGSPIAPSETTFTLNQGDDPFEFKARFNAVQDGDLLDSMFIDSDSPGQESRRIKLRLQSLPASIDSNTNWGVLNDDKTDSFLITANNRADTNGNTLVQISDHLVRFELAQRSTVRLSVRGQFVTDLVTHAAPSALVTADGNPIGQMSVGERENPRIAPLTATPDDTGTSGPEELDPGKYLIYLTAISTANGNGSNSGDEMRMNVTLGLTVDAVELPKIQVKGNNLVIANNDTTPSSNDGTSFGQVNTGQDLPTLSFTVTNNGGSTLNIGGNAPDVSGDFLLFEDVLNTTIAPGAFDTFKVKLNSTSAGEKSGTVVIQSDAQGGNFTFSIGGTVVAVPGEPQFAELVGTTLTITGTNGDDSVSTLISGSGFFAIRNGVQSQAFAITAVTKIIVDLLDGNDGYSSATQLDIRQTINGGNGNDLLRGGKQVDRIFGNDGDDRMDGRSRGDTLDGGGGSDVALYRQRRANEPVTVILDTLPNDGGAADLNRDFVPADTTEHVYGGLGNDNLTGSSKTNRLFGFEGNDTIAGLKGNDTLEGGDGANNLNGGFGNDRFFSRNSIADIVDGGAGTDTLTGDTIDNVSNVENED